MADTELQILIKARNQAKAEFDKLNKQVNDLQGKKGFSGLSDKLVAADQKFKSLTGVSLGFASAAGLAGAAVSGIVKFLRQAVDKSVAYATEIDNMSRLLGISTEDTSRLVQASDDLFISQEILTSGLQAATRQGIDVSIEGLKKLSEQYNSLPAGVTRSEFVLKTFGRSGAEMGKLMEVGADGIDEATAAIADNMIVTEKSMQQVIAYKQSVDNMSDSWQGFKYQVGMEIIPELNLLLMLLVKGTSDAEEQAKAVANLERKLNNYEIGAQVAFISDKKRAEAMEELRAQINWLTGSYEKGEAGVSGFYKGISNMTPVVDDLADSFLEVNQENEKYIKGIGTWQGMQDDYKQSMEDNAESIAGVKEELKKLTEQPYLSEDQKGQILELQGKLGELEQDQKDIQDAAELKTNTVILGYMQEKLAADGNLTDEETEWLIGKGVEWGIYSEKAVQAYKDAQDAADEFLEHRNDAEHDKTVTVTYQIKMEGGFEGAGWSIGKMEADSGIDWNRNGIIGQAHGGPVASSTPYIVGEAGPELFIPGTSGRIIPNQQLVTAQGRGGGQTVVNFIYSPAMSMGDRIEMETRVIPIFRRLLEQV